MKVKEFTHQDTGYVIQRITDRSYKTVPDKLIGKWTSDFNKAKVYKKLSDAEDALGTIEIHIARVCRIVEIDREGNAVNG